MNLREFWRHWRHYKQHRHFTITFSYRNGEHQSTMKVSEPMILDWNHMQIEFPVQGDPIIYLKDQWNRTHAYVKQSTKEIAKQELMK